MQLFNNPPYQDWKAILQRPYMDNMAITQSVTTILNDVKQNGDDALKRLTRQFDGATLDALQVSETEIYQSESQLSVELKNAIQQAKQNIAVFHSFQMHKPRSVETMPGIECWRKSVGIEKVGLYVPGGSAPLFSTILMLGIPAAIAGCKEVALCTPCNKEGRLHPAILFTAGLVGIKKIFKIGGAQAIAAMAYGTETIPAVYKIFGPGNQYVTAAKQLVQMDGVAIDMPAGPSEVCILADDTANPVFVAADLLSQAEHGADSQVLLVSNSQTIVQSVFLELEKQLSFLPRKDLVRQALANSKAIVFHSIEEAVELVNEYAAEHLIICCKEADAVAEKISNAGSVFIGNYAPESAGDYASGTNHTLPTNAFARAYSGVSVDSFVKKITFQKLTQQGLKSIADTVIEMAEAEGLRAHAHAVRVRMSEPEFGKI